jgi:hypothetical protein
MNCSSTVRPALALTGLRNFAAGMALSLEIARWPHAAPLQERAWPAGGELD